jgi:hypothetical protein
MTNIEERVDKLYMDMYIGEGKSNPPMTTRLSLLEDQMEKINRNLAKITWLLVAMLLTTIGELIMKGVR